MKSLVSLFLLLVLLAPLAGTYTWLHYRKAAVRKQVKRELKKHIPKEDLIFFKFSKKDSQEKLQWKHSKEFEYQGEMYDVVQKAESGDSITYECWWDHEETRLNMQLAQLVRTAFQSDPISQRQQNRLLFYLHLPFLSPMEKIAITAPYRIIKIGFIEQLFNPKSCFEVDSPPPQMMS